MLIVNVPDVALGAPLLPPVAKNVAWYVPMSLAVGVSVILHSSSYSVEVPEPVVAWVQPGVVVGSEASEGRAPEATVMDVG
jgi:hypothetical protein